MHQINLGALPKPLCYRNLLRDFLQGLTSMTTNPINQQDADGKKFMQLYVILTKLRNWILMCMVNFCILASYVFHMVKESTR
jgi:hypothetical protein